MTLLLKTTQTYKQTTDYRLFYNADIVLTTKMDEQLENVLNVFKVHAK